MGTILKTILKTIVGALLLLSFCFTVINADSKTTNRQKCNGTVLCNVCGATCNNCSYCKAGKKCGSVRNPNVSAKEKNLQNVICEGVSIHGTLGNVFLPLPATTERVKKNFEQAGLSVRGNIAIDSGKEGVKERYRLTFTDEHLTGVSFDTIFTDPNKAAYYADSITKALRSATQSKDEVFIALGLGGDKTYYVPAMLCGNRAIGYIFTLTSNLSDKTAVVTCDVKVVSVPQN